MRRFYALVLTVFVGPSVAFAQSGSPYESSADFARYAMKLREQGLPVRLLHWLQRVADPLERLQLP